MHKLSDEPFFKNGAKIRFLPETAKLFAKKPQQRALFDLLSQLLSSESQNVKKLL
jgi:hypothetical protein